MAGMTAKAVHHVNKVYTAKGYQHHRGYTGYVYITGYRRPFKTGTHHRKPRAAIAEAEKMGRWLLKSPENVQTAIDNGWMVK